MNRLLLIVVFCALFAGCATSRPTMSYVAPELTTADATVIATDVIDYLSRELPPGRTVLTLDPPPQDVIGPQLINRLPQKGFGLGFVDPDDKTADRSEMLLRYVVVPLDSGFVVRLQYQGREASRFYNRTTDGDLIPISRFAVREAAK